MTQDEKSVASILLANIANSVEEGDSVTSAIARYQEFVEACNFRRRCLVNGWTELESLSDVPEEEYTPDDTDWWVAELNPYGVAEPFDGPHTDRESAEKSLPLIRSLSDRKGELVIVKSEIYKIAAPAMTAAPQKTNTKWWILDEDEFGNISKFDGPHESQVEALRAKHSIGETRRKLVIAEIEVPK